MKLVLLVCLCLLVVACEEYPTPETIGSNEYSRGSVATACKTICDSHGYENSESRDGHYQNPVCYCSDNESRIWTFVM